ncbi:MAG TPA: tetratricopeptide repeat protein [Allosphingosinicella sp.]|nr:tetratricopeptide repeat protein [Allosphingosinicella sp.]
MRGWRFLAPALLLAVAGCANGPGRQSAQESYRRGLAALRQGQPRTARIELLNAISAAPNDGRIRIAAAETDIALGDGIAAEAELRRALALGIGADAVHHLMAHAFLLEHRPDDAIAEAAQAPKAYEGYAERIRGLAAMDLGDNAQAAAALNAAIQAAPKDSGVWTAVARFRRTTGELAGAIDAADKAVASDPNDAEALELHGELTRSQYGLAAALPWFDRALQIDPKYIPAMVEKASTLGDLGRAGDMLAEARAILAVDPKNPNAWLLQAVLAARAGKYDLARSLYRRTSGALDDQPAALLLAAAVDLQTGNAEQGVQKLQRLLVLQPDNMKARRLLASGQWRLGDAAGAAATLRPLADRADAGAYALMLMGEALAKQGDRAGASLYFARALQPRSGAAVLGGPVSDDQLAAFRAAAAANPRDAGIGIQLIRALLARGVGGEALDRARILEAQNPGAPDAHMLAGDALGLQGDWRGAAEAYRRAADIAFSEPVALRLVEALRNANDGPGAAHVLALFLRQNPDNVAALTLAGNDWLAAGAWDQAIAAYERVRARIGDRDAILLNNLAWAYAQAGEDDQALPLAARAWSLDRRNPATAGTLGWLLFKSGRDRLRGLALLEQAARGAPAKGS